MSLVATRLQNWRVNSPEFDRNMARPREYGALDFFIQQTEAPNSIISQNLRDRAFASIGNTVQIPVINDDEDVQVSNVRSCVIPDSANTSALYTVVWKTLSVGFSIVPSAYMNNEIDVQKDFERKMEKVIRALATELDKGAIASLEANKTQVFADLLQYAQVGNVVQVPIQMATEILGDTNPMMRANNYPRMLHIIGNAGVDSLIRKLAQHDVYNDVNKRMEYDNKVVHYTNNIVNEAGKNGTFFAVEDGNVGILTRVDRESLRRAKAYNTEWDVVRLPYIDLPVGAVVKTEVGDQSSTDGAATADLTCAVKEYYGFSLDVAYLVAYNNDLSTIANPIIKAEIEAPATNQPYATPVYVANASQIGQPTPTITLSDDTVTVAENATETITATTTPNAFVVDWSSSDEAVATVAGGVITGVAAGSATITAKITVDGYNYTATCAVTVTA